STTVTCPLSLHDALPICVNWFGQIRSGAAYTPSIAGDVNGDGYSNDRAFIFNPDNTADPALASAMRQLLATSTGSAKDCLLRQLDRKSTRLNSSHDQISY